MDSFTLTIRGSGGGTDPNVSQGANKLVSDFVTGLRNSGVTIESAEYVSGDDRHDVLKSVGHLTGPRSSSASANNNVKSNPVPEAEASPAVSAEVEAEAPVAAKAAKVEETHAAAAHKKAAPTKATATHAPAHHTTTHKKH